MKYDFRSKMKHNLSGATSPIMACKTCKKPIRWVKLYRIRKWHPIEAKKIWVEPGKNVGLIVLASDDKISGSGQVINTKKNPLQKGEFMFVSHLERCKK